MVIIDPTCRKFSPGEQNLEFSDARTLCNGPQYLGVIKECAHKDKKVFFQYILMIFNIAWDSGRVWSEITVKYDTLPRNTKAFKSCAPYNIAIIAFLFI